MSETVFGSASRVGRNRKNKSGVVKLQQFGILMEARLTTCMQEGLNEQRKFYFLEKALRNLTNMVPPPTQEDLDEDN